MLEADMFLTMMMMMMMLQECDVKLIPGNLYVMHGHNLYCQTHYHGDGSVPLSHDLPPEANQREGERCVFYVTNILVSWLPCSCIRYIL